MSHLLDRDHNPPPFEGFFWGHFGPFSLIKNLLNQKIVLVTFKKIGFVTFWQSLPSKTMCKKSQHSIKVISRKLENRIKHISQKKWLEIHGTLIFLSIFREKNCCSNGARGLATILVNMHTPAPKQLKKVYDMRLINNIELFYPGNIKWLIHFH